MKKEIKFSRVCIESKTFSTQIFQPICEIFETSKKVLFSWFDQTKKIRPPWRFRKFYGLVLNEQGGSK